MNIKLHSERKNNLKKAFFIRICEVKQASVGVTNRERLNIAVLNSEELLRKSNHMCSISV